MKAEKRKKNAAEDLDTIDIHKMPGGPGPGSKLLTCMPFTDHVNMYGMPPASNMAGLPGFCYAGQADGWYTHAGLVSTAPYSWGNEYNEHISEWPYMCGAEPTSGLMPMYGAACQWPWGGGAMQSIGTCDMPAGGDAFTLSDVCPGMLVGGETQVPPCMNQGMPTAGEAPVPLGMSAGTSLNNPFSRSAENHTAAGYYMAPANYPVSEIPTVEDCLAPTVDYPLCESFYRPMYPITDENEAR